MPSTELKETDDLRELFLNDVPLLDVRAPAEFAEGAFPFAENHPLIDDEERHEIGIAYKEDGQDQAIELGETLVSGELKQKRIERWRDFLERHPNAVLYCFRGGMRSRTSQRWLLEETGIHRPRVRGGYKAMRRFLIDEIQRNSAICTPVVIGGRTGVGKTRLLALCDSMIDLEGLAHHRGSAFGHHPQPQPTQINFENSFSIALLKQVAADNQPFAVEDESRNIGSRHVPPAFFRRMETAPLVLLEAGDDERVDITLQEYVHDSLGAFQNASGTETGFADWAAYLQNSMDRIRRRLGGDRHARVSGMLQEAIARHAANGDTEGHRAWIAYLLHEYYDGMYEYQLGKKSHRIVFSGTQGEVCDYLRDTYGIGRRKTA
ncbi:MAG: tRNA 2-selenouridine(34) synthase MnmH [Sedimenticolaceae bacterium]